MHYLCLLPTLTYTPYIYLAYLIIIALCHFDPCHFAVPYIASDSIKPYSFILAISIAPFKSSTTQRRSRLQHEYCIGVSRRSAQATAGKGLAQGPYVTARAGVEPTTLWLKAIASA